MRLDYLPVLRYRLSQPLVSRGAEGAEEVVELLDAYSLSRDDMMTSLPEFALSGVADPLAGVDSKAKTKLTRLYNATAHHGQALAVDAKTLKLRAAALTASTDGAGAGDDDDDADEEEEDDDDSLPSVAKGKGKSKGKGKGKGRKAGAGAGAGAKGRGKGKAKAKA